MHFVCPLPPKCRISKMFSFSWELKWPQERTMLMQNFGGTNKEHYGLLWFWSGHLHSRVWLDWMSVFFFFYQTVFFRGGTGENGFREWHNRGKHSINQVKLRGFAHVALTIIRCLLTFCFFALFFNFTLFFFIFLPFFRHACARASVTTCTRFRNSHFFYATYNIKELQCSHEDTLQSLKSEK